MEKIAVLGAGHVGLLESMGSDLSVVRNARVSYDAEWRTGEDEGKDEKLIRYLMKNHHTSPFESVTFTFDIKCPIFIARQWHRHRTWSFNEVSARYSELPSDFYLPDEEHIGTQSTHNKQMRDLTSNSAAGWARRAMQAHFESSYILYQRMLERGIPRELARTVLPVSIFTHFMGTIDLHNLFHFLKLRLHEHAQYEIRVYAEAILSLITPVVPVCVKSFKEYMLNAPPEV